MKTHLVTTVDKYDKLMRDFSSFAHVGFDTEVVGPVKRYSQSKDDPFVNVRLSSLQGASFGFPNGNTYYLPIRHRKQNAKWAWLDSAWEALSGMEQVWTHNLKFDSRVMEREGYSTDGIYMADSLLVAWAYYSRTKGNSLKQLAKALFDRVSPEWSGSLVDKTGAEVLEYTCHDALNTLEVGNELFARCPAVLKAWLEGTEWPLAIELGRMEERGIPIDLDILEEGLGEAALSMREQAEKEWFTYTSVNPHSPKDLQPLFENGTWKSDMKTKKGEYATGKAVMEEQIARGGMGAELARLLLDIRKSTKAFGTYVEQVREEVRQWGDGRRRPELFQMGTRTTRFSSSGPNIQNQMAREKELAPLLLKSYVAPDGFTYVGADYSQQEPRIFACLCGPGPLQRIFQEGRDIHQEQADSFGGTRDEGKTWNMGYLMYGGNKWGAHYNFGWPLDEAERRIKANFTAFPEGPAFRKKVLETAVQREPWPYVKLVTGYRSFIKEMVPERWKKEEPEAYKEAIKDLIKKKPYLASKMPREQDKKLKEKGERMALNTIVQGNGAAMTKRAIVLFTQAVKGTGAYVVSTTHDDIWAAAPTGKAAATKLALEDCMREAAVELGFKQVPFEVEGKMGQTWYDIK